MILNEHGETQYSITLSADFMCRNRSQASIFDDLLAQPQYNVGEYENPEEFGCEALVL